MVEKTIGVSIEGRNRAKQAFDQLSTQTKTFGDRLKSVLATTRDLAVVFTVGKRALEALTGGFSNVTSAAQTQLRAELKLADALSRSTTNVKAQFQAIDEWAGALQNLTGIGDEVTKNYVANLLTIKGVSVDLAKDIVDIAAVTEFAFQKKAQPLLQQFERLLKGGTAQLDRYSVVLDKTLSPAEQVTQAIEQLRERAGNLANVLGKTAIGRMAAFSAATGDLQETFGLAIIQSDVFNNIIDVATGSVQGLTGALGSQEQTAKALSETMDFVGRTIINVVFDVVIAVLRAADAFKSLAESIFPFARITDPLETRLKAVQQRMDELSASGADLEDPLSKDAQEMNSLAVEASSLQAALERTDPTVLIANLETLRQQLIQNREELKSLSDVLGEFQQRQVGIDFIGVQAFAAGLEAISTAIAPVQQELQGLSSLSRQFGLSFQENQVSVEEFAQAAVDAGIQFEETFAIAFDQALEQGLIRFNDFQQALIDFPLIVNEAFQSTAAGIESSFGGLFVDLADKTVTASEAFKNFGEKVKNIAIQNFGQALAKILLRPLTLFIDTIAVAVSKFIAQALALATFGDALRAAEAAKTVGAATLVGTSWAPAAVAAAMATLGGALAFGTAAQAQILAASVPVMQEGGIVSPTPFGMIVRVAEAGEPEAILPIRKGSALDDLTKRNGGFEMGGRQIVISELNVNVEGISSDTDVDELAEAVSQRLVETIRLSEV